MWMSFEPVVPRVEISLHDVLQMTDFAVPRVYGVEYLGIV
jgi:hypothetical protein